MITDIVLKEFDIDTNKKVVEKFGTGLINSTWKVSIDNHAYILQKINTQVFRNPDLLIHNTDQLNHYLQNRYPEYQLISPLATAGGKKLIHINGSDFRLYPFVKGSHSIDTVKSTKEAYEAAKQFGKFTRLLAGVDVNTLKVTIPAFHDLTLRYQQFIQAISKGDQQRVKEASKWINKIIQNNKIVETYQYITNNPAFKLRVTHHDTKISNVLFNDKGEGICVIDLDTVMPGYFISDVGDMLRTYLSPVSEEETNLSRIQIREEIYKAIKDGYCSEMQTELSTDEADHFFYAGQFMIYMQAVRFLTDYLQNDVYYTPAYPHHNLYRAQNQLTLLEKLIEKRHLL